MRTSKCSCTSFYAGTCTLTTSSFFGQAVLNNYMNSWHYCIRIHGILNLRTPSILKKKLFLDLIIIKDHEGNINMTLFRKNTARNTILRAESAHVPQFIAIIPYGNILPLPIFIKRNCSTQQQFVIEANALRLRLLERSYSNCSLKWAFNKANGQNKHDLIFKPK